jgi:hypothetical protein
MATITTDKRTGIHRLQFTTQDGNRQTVQLGRIKKELAREIGRHIDHLVRCGKSGEEPKSSTAEWIAQVRDDWPRLAKRLNALRLIGNGARLDEGFVSFAERYVASRGDVKPATVRVWNQTLDQLRTFFPELLPYLLEIQELAENGEEFVIAKRRKTTDANLRRRMGHIVVKAGFEKWPKIFHNLRASRQIELEDQFPSHVVCAWLGNSQEVARYHYLQTLDSHFDQAVTGPVELCVQKATQHPQETTRTDAKPEPLPFVRRGSPDPAVPPDRRSPDTAPCPHAIAGDLRSATVARSETGHNRRRPATTEGDRPQLGTDDN